LENFLVALVGAVTSEAVFSGEGGVGEFAVVGCESYGVDVDYAGECADRISSVAVGAE